MPHQRLDQLAGLVGRERLELDDARPAGRRSPQLRTGGGDDRQGMLGRPEVQVLEEVEQAVVGPVEVLEDEHDAARSQRALR